MSFKAEICIATELYMNNDPEQGCDPDTLQDNGMVQTIVKPTLNELKEAIQWQFGVFEHFEANRYETGYEEFIDGIYYSNMVSIYIYEVTEREVRFTDIELNYGPKKAI